MANCQSDVLALLVRLQHSPYKLFIVEHDLIIMKYADKPKTDSPVDKEALARARLTNTKPGQKKFG